MLLLVLPHVIFYLGLCGKKWKRHAGRKGSPCPFTNAPAHNQCRVCGTFVSDRAFHRTCSITTQQNNGNGTTTVTTTTATGWNHCAGCQYLKGQALMVLFLLAMFCLWAYTVIERTLAVTGVGHRDERVRTFNMTLYTLTVLLGLISWATVWCTRRTLLKFTCLTPCGGSSCCCCASPAPTGPSHTADATAPAPAARVTTAASTPPSEVVVVQGVPVCGSV